MFVTRKELKRNLFSIFYIKSNFLLKTYFSIMESWPILKLTGFLSKVEIERKQVLSRSAHAKSQKINIIPFIQL